MSGIEEAFQGYVYLSILKPIMERNQFIIDTFEDLSVVKEHRFYIENINKIENKIRIIDSKIGKVDKILEEALIEDKTSLDELLIYYKNSLNFIMKIFDEESEKYKKSLKIVSSIKIELSNYGK